MEGESHGGFPLRYCKKCKAAFTAAKCPSAHPSFVYSNKVPEVNRIAAEKPAAEKPAAERAAAEKAAAERAAATEKVLTETAAAGAEETQTGVVGSHPVDTAKSNSEGHSKQEKGQIANPLKAMMPFLRAATISDKLVKRGDTEKIPETIASYKEALECIEQVINDPSTKDKLLAKMGDKRAIIVKRLGELSPPEPEPNVFPPLVSTAPPASAAPVLAADAAPAVQSISEQEPGNAKLARDEVASAPGLQTDMPPGGAVARLTTDVDADAVMLPQEEIAHTSYQPPLFNAAELQSELRQLKMPDLRKRAAAAGVADDKIEEARDMDDPKVELVSLIVAAARGQAEAVGQNQQAREAAPKADLKAQAATAATGAEKTVQESVALELGGGVRSSMTAVPRSEQGVSALAVAGGADHSIVLGLQQEVESLHRELEAARETSCSIDARNQELLRQVDELREAKIVAEDAAHVAHRRETDAIHTADREAEARQRAEVMLEESRTEVSLLKTMSRAAESAGTTTAHEMQEKYALERVARANAEKRLLGAEAALSKAMVSAASLARVQQQVVAKQVSNALHRAASDHQEAQKVAVAKAAQNEQRTTMAEVRLEAELEYRQQLEAKSRLTSDALSATVARLAAAATLLKTVTAERDSAQDNLRILEAERLAAQQQAIEEQEAQASADGFVLGNDGFGVQDVPNPLMMDDEELYSEFIEARQYVSDVAQYQEEGIKHHSGRRTIMVQTETRMSRTEEGWKDEAEYALERLREEIELRESLEGRLARSVALREDAEATAAERERSRLAVLRDLEESGPARCEQLSGEVAALRLALAKTTHLLEEEQQRAQMYAEDVVEAQARCTEEKEARAGVELKLETAALVEEELTILREHVRKIETDSAVGQRTLYQMHDQAYEFHTVLSEERDAAHERAQAAEQEVSTLRNRITEMQSIYFEAEQGLGAMKEQAVVAVETIKVEAEQARRELEAAAAGQLQQEMERRVQAEKEAAALRTELLGMRSSNEQLEMTVEQATSKLKAAETLQAKAAGLETSVAVTQQQLQTAEDQRATAQKEVAAEAAARRDIEMETARLAATLRDAESEIVRMQVHADAAKEAADQRMASAVAEAGEPKHAALCTHLALTQIFCVKKPFPSRCHFVCV